MRIVNKSFNINQILQQTVEATKEEITLINENKQQKSIYIETIYKDINGNIIENTSTVISGDNYNLLMSQSPEFAPNKPLNEYREVDLFYIIDKIRSEQK